GFLTIHFTRVESFSTIISGIAVKGRSSVGTSLSDPQIRQLRIQSNGIELVFRNRDKAVLITDDGIRHSLDITGWETEEGAIRVIFSEDTALKIVSNTHEGNLSIIPEIPTTIPPVRSLEIPFKPGEKVEISVRQDHPGTLSIISPDMEYIASLPSDSTWNAVQKRLNLVVLNKADPNLEISDDHRGGGLNAEEWYNQGSAPSPDVYNNAVETWLSASRNNWKTRLEIKSTIQWDNNMAAAVLADAVSRKVLPSQLTTLLSQAEKTPKDIGWLPSPYLGNIVNQSRVHRQELETIARNLITGLKNESPDFGVKTALISLLDSGYSQEAALLVDFSRQLPPPESTNSEIINRLSILIKAEDLSLNDPANDPAIRRHLFDSFIIPRIFWVKDGLWLIEADGAINLNLSIAAGVILIREAQKNNDSLYQSVGRQLILSAMSYAEKDGIIPEKLFFSADGGVKKEGSILPENLYPLIVNPPAYPRHVSLTQELGPGSWSLTG
ncbi:MAG: hypothetical protein KAH21_05100, partial [Spirochaetaceae bacterium]|nr:hypothetical protein [Spirochaetaceae bacterium]